MDIQKSKITLQKEKQIADLQKKIKRTNTTIKALKTRLTNTQTELVDLQKDLFNKSSRLLEEMSTLTNSLVEQYKKFKKDKRFKKQDKKLVADLYQVYIEPGLEDFQNMPPFEPPFDESQERARERDPFEDFREAPEPEEQRSIRKLYLSLSKRLHPDKAKNEAEQERYHTLQQNLNEAYQRHDFQALLSLEAELTLEEPVPTTSLDALDSKIQQLENQLELLEDQKERLSAELKNIRQSDPGEMLSFARSQQRQGASVEEAFDLDKMDQELFVLREMDAALKDSLESGKLSEGFQMLNDRLQSQVDETLSMMGDLFGLDSDDLSAMADLVDGDDVINPDPKFEIGSHVKVVADLLLPYEVEKNGDYILEELNAKGLSGFVSKTLLDDFDDDISIYEVALDKPSLEALPVAFIETHLRGFNRVMVEGDWFLKRMRKGSIKLVEESKRYCQELLLQWVFHSLPEEQLERLREILLADPFVGDYGNWLNYLEQNVPLPVGAEVCGEELFLKKGTKVKIWRPTRFDEDYGIMVLVEHKKELEEVPLFELESKEGAARQALADHRAWWMAAQGFDAPL